MLINIAIDVNEGKPLAASYLDEPYIFRQYICRWVKEAIEEVKAVKKNGD